MPIEPDTKDWTWVLREPCDECGLEAGTVVPELIPQMLRDNAGEWQAVRARTDADWWTQRPNAQTWSPLEYAAHVRDVHGVFAERLGLMQTEEDPTFPNWDQDAAAIKGNYAQEDADQVLAELRERAEPVAERYQRLSRDQWQRTGRRSDGAQFTAVTLAQYHLHDVIHHLGDITR